MVYEDRQSVSDLEILSASLLERENVLPLCRRQDELYRLDDEFLWVYVQSLSFNSRSRKKAVLKKKIRRLSRGFRYPSHIIKINTAVTQCTSAALHALDSSLGRF